MKYSYRNLLLGALVLLLTPAIGVASERDARKITKRIERVHRPHGTIISPLYTSPESNVIDRYTRGGDSAIWTGHYVAAEAFRYRVTGSKDALANVKSGLLGIRALVNITGEDLLARCRVPVEWEDGTNKRSIITEEAGHGVYVGTLKGGERSYWIGNTSRDQFCGVFFGMAVAYQLIDESDDPKIRRLIRKTVTRLLDRLLEDDWAVVMPDGSISTVFSGRVDQQLTLLQIGRLVSPSVYTARYFEYRDRYADLVGIPIVVESLDDHSSYFKFNLDYINLYSLVLLEEADSSARRDYLGAYRWLRLATRSHGNAHFNTIDLAIEGPNAERDEETRELLQAWLLRPKRDDWIDLRCCYPSEDGERTTIPIPVVERVTTDFLWQRSPFQLYGGGAGTIESPGIDYILPYWMARYHGVDVGS